MVFPRSRTLNSTRSPVLAAREHSHHRSDIQGLRAIAVLLVVANHAGLPLPGGFIGVDIFFVISGYVISSLILRELRDTGRIDFKRFYSRRARRLMPAFLLTTVTVLAISIFLLSPTGTQQESAHLAAWSSVFAGNIYLYQLGMGYFTDLNTNPFIHLWSLGVEEQTYLVLPFLLAGAWSLMRRLRRGHEVLYIAISLLMTMSLAVSLLAVFAPSLIPIPVPNFAFYLPMTRFWEFSIGVLLSLVHHSGGRSRSHVWAPIGPLGFAIVACSAIIITKSSSFPGVVAIVPAVGAGLMIADTATGTLWHRFIAHRFMTWVGDISYEWYLLHWPAIVFAGLVFPDHVLMTVAVSVLMLPVARLMQVALDQRFRRNDRVVGRRLLALVATSVLLPVSLATFINQSAHRG